jgi:hypothetical protein
MRHKLQLDLVKIRACLVRYKFHIDSLQSRITIVRHTICINNLAGDPTSNSTLCARQRMWRKEGNGLMTATCA